MFLCLICKSFICVHLLYPVSALFYILSTAAAIQFSHPKFLMFTQSQYPSHKITKQISQCLCLCVFFKSEKCHGLLSSPHLTLSVYVWHLILKCDVAGISCSPNSCSVSLATHKEEEFPQRISKASCLHLLTELQHLHFYLQTFSNCPGFHIKVYI